MEKANLRQGFTMIEVMLVLLIMASLAAVSIGAINALRKRAHVSLAETQIQELSKHIEMYNVTVGNYPATDEGLEALHTCPSSVSNPDKWTKLVTKIPMDPWGNPFQYQYPSSHDSEFDIWSCGLDGISGTDDDITSWGI